MSGIVRGWADSMDDLREILYTKQMHDEDIPVAVVPLDDATLAEMAEKIARADFDDATMDMTWEQAQKSLRDVYVEIAMKGLRAALKLS